MTVLSRARFVPSIHSGGVGSSDTSIVAVSVKPPSTVVTVILVFPTDSAVTSPLLSTVAILVSLDSQVTEVLVALTGKIVAVSCCVPPSIRILDVGFNSTPVTGIGAQLAP